jgi:L-amino acid N-acyltransferase YncA
MMERDMADSGHGGLPPVPEASSLPLAVGGQGASSLLHIAVSKGTAVIIRDALDADIPDIVAIVNAFLRTTTAEWREAEYTVEDRRDWLVRHQHSGDAVLIAEIDGVVAGFSCYGDFRDSQKWPGYRFVVENTIHVREPFWGNGVGRALIEALLERAAAAGKRMMVAAVDAENVGSIRFHEHCGFIEVGRMPSIGFKFGRWLTLVLLQRPVDLVAPAGLARDEDGARR